MSTTLSSKKRAASAVQPELPLEILDLQEKIRDLKYQLRRERVKKSHVDMAKEQMRELQSLYQRLGTLERMVLRRDAKISRLTASLRDANELYKANHG